MAESLLPNESLIWETNLHGIVFLGPALLIILGLAGGAFIVVTGSDSVCGWLSSFVAFYGILALIAAGITQHTSEFAVTDRRVLIKTGFIRRRSLELLLTKVEGIGVNQGIVGRLIGFGTITVTGTGGTKETFANIADPLEFRRQVQNQIDFI